MRNTSTLIRLHWQRLPDGKPVVVEFKKRDPFEIIERVEQELFHKGDNHGTPERRS